MASNKHILITALTLSLASSLAHAGAVPAEPDNAAGFNFPAVGLVKTVRAHASKYQSVHQAEADGYIPATGCVSGPSGGAMGVHYARLDLLGDGAVDAATPELLVYEPTIVGGMHLVAVEYVVIKDAWEANNGAGTPAILEGQHMMLTGAPNRYGLPTHYMLHVWAFRKNPLGMFAPWNPDVTCEYYAPDAA